MVKPASHHSTQCVNDGLVRVPQIFLKGHFFLGRHEKTIDTHCDWGSNVLDILEKHTLFDWGIWSSTPSFGLATCPSPFARPSDRMLRAAPGTCKPVRACWSWAAQRFWRVKQIDMGTGSTSDTFFGKSQQKPHGFWSFVPDKCTLK